MNQLTTPAKISYTVESKAPLIVAKFDTLPQAERFFDEVKRLYPLANIHIYQSQKLVDGGRA